MIKEVTYHQAICDRCGKNAHEDGEYTAWDGPGAARDDAQAQDWLVDVGPDGLDICNRCQGDEDDQRACEHAQVRRTDEKCPDCGLTLKVGARNAIDRADLASSSPC